MTEPMRHNLLPTTSRGSHGQVVEGVGQAIVAGRFQPGGQLPRDEQLAQEFGVSRTVLREAMKTLAAKGMISARARVGTTVRARHEWNMLDGQVLRWHLDSEQTSGFFEQLFEMRLAFEPFAAGLSAAKASASDVERMRRFVREMDAAETELDFALADLEFHRAVLDATGNAFFHSVGSLVEAALLAALRRSSPAANRDLRSVIADRHGRIAEAIAAGDRGAAEDAMRDVIRAGWVRIAASPAAADGGHSGAN
jgi:DNA-binding FadR family transcriptional regulator